MAGKPPTPAPALVENKVEPRTVIAWINCPDCGAYCDQKISVNALSYYLCSRCNSKKWDPKPISLRKLRNFLDNKRQPVDLYNTEREEKLLAAFRAGDDQPKPKGAKRYGYY